MGCTASSSTRLVTTHSVHHTQQPQYPQRAKVDHVQWTIPDPEYKPVDFTHQAVIDNDRNKVKGGWADPVEYTAALQKEIAQRVSNALKVGGNVRMVKGYPRNPIGRTGMTGRGLLGKYGPNQAADAIVTRFDENKKLQLVSVRRCDNDIWAIPGGMINKKETARQAALREFFEEACAVEQLGNVKQHVENLFTKGGSAVYIGYVDDPRNTDIAWIETMCLHFHIDDNEIANALILKAGDDAKDVKWLDVDDNNEAFKNLFANHRLMVKCALTEDLIKFGEASNLVNVE